jgi:uncharacterized protein YdhG (YjbR/CyaY superfamily)
MSDLARARDIEKYIAKQVSEMQLVLHEVRRQIREVLPEAKEAFTGRKPALKYRNPFFVYWAEERNLVVDAVVEHAPELMRELDQYAEKECGRVWHWSFRIDSTVPYKLIVKMALVAAAAGKEGHTLYERDYP